MTISSAFLTAAAAAEALPLDAAAYSAISEAELLEVARIGAQTQNAAARANAVIAGEIARRSAPSLGHDGLAQRLGARTPEELVRVTTGSTTGEAFAAVRVGRLAQEAAGLADPITGEVPEPAQPWLREVGLAAGAGTISVAAVEAIAKGLGTPTQGVTAEVLATAAAALVAEAPDVDATRLLKNAIDARNELDVEGIIDRERKAYDDRSATFTKNADGTGRLVVKTDLHDTAAVATLFDRTLSPRIGGPRFVDPDTAAMAKSILDDPRSNEQLAYDVLLHTLFAGADADSSQLLGTGAPQVRIIVTAAALESGTGHGWYERTGAPVSLTRVKEAICAGETTPILMDTALGGTFQPLDVGREQRLFTKRQKIALAARDGGCRWPGCERPPSWTEAHHVNWWLRDDGRTDVADGILLCKHHHLLLHDHHWEIERQGSDYWVVPPPDIDPAQTPIAMPTKSKAMRQLQRELQLVE